MIIQSQIIRGGYTKLSLNVNFMAYFIKNQILISKEVAVLNVKNRKEKWQ